MYFGARPEIFRKAQTLRQNPTEAEKIMWNYLRQFRSGGLVFRRQHPIDIFIADFYCHKLKLIIEVDGEVHFNKEAIEHDDGRTAVLERLGIKVIRFTNDQVINNKDLIISEINRFIIDHLPPLPRERGIRGGEAAREGGQML